MQFHDLLIQLREERSFDPALYLTQKIDAINKHFTENNIEAAIVEVSKSLGSAVSFSIMERAMFNPRSPLRYVLGIVIVKDGREDTTASMDFLKGISNLHKGTAQTKNIGVHLVNIAESVSSMQKWALLESRESSDDSLIKLVRSTTLHYHTAILAQLGQNAVVVGSLNRDEGSYMGAFGKFTENAVDILPISDLHTSELITLAEYLKIPDEIIDSVSPKISGIPAWFIELYLLLKNKPTEEKLRMIGMLEENSSKAYFEYAEAIETHHANNFYVYVSQSPAFFPDVKERKVIDGW
jgi:NH3-dependent NAD+ synthetase